MNESGTNDSGREDRLNEILLEYLRAVDAGQHPDRQEWISRYPEFAQELEEYFDDQDRVEALGHPARSGDDPTTPLSDRVPPPGSRVRYVGDYELLEEIARGGMGVVYKARQQSLNRTVAIKMILAGRLASEEDIRRFHSEAGSAAALDHPGIVPIYEVGEHEGHHYFSMGYVDGKSLARMLVDGPLPARKAAELTLKIAEAVQYAHEHGVIHRDLKPGNVVLDGNEEPRVTDFGLAKRVVGDSSLTATGQVLGTPSYMPLEQAVPSSSQVDERADVYSLGAILYALLTGRPPFQADSAANTLMQVIEQDPVSLRQLNSTREHSGSVGVMQRL